jgi:hypothetical protein
MKIDGQDPTKNIQAPGGAKKTASAGLSADGLFLDALKQAADNLTAKPGGASQPLASGLGPLASSSFIPFMSGTADPASSAMVGKLDGLFNDLSMFKNALGNTSIPMDRLAPLARELVARKDEIAGMIGGIGDEKLKGIATDALRLTLDHISSYYAGQAA